MKGFKLQHEHYIYRTITSHNLLYCTYLSALFWAKIFTFTSTKHLQVVLSAVFLRKERIEDVWKSLTFFPTWEVKVRRGREGGWTERWTDGRTDR